MNNCLYLPLLLLSSPLVTPILMVHWYLLSVFEKGHVKHSWLTFAYMHMLDHFAILIIRCFIGRSNSKERWWWKCMWVWGAWLVEDNNIYNFWVTLFALCLRRRMKEMKKALRYVLTFKKICRNPIPVVAACACVKLLCFG